MIRNKNPPTARIHSKIIIAEIIMRFFKDFLLAAFPLLVLQNCIIEIISVNTAMAGSAKSINSIFSPQYSASRTAGTTQQASFPKGIKATLCPSGIIQQSILEQRGRTSSFRPLQQILRPCPHRKS